MRLSSRSAVGTMTGLLAILGFAQQQTRAWKEYAFANDGFAITLPNKPTPHAEFGLPDSTVYSVPLGTDSKLSLHVTHNVTDCTAKLSEIKAGALRGSQDATSVKDVKLDEYPGVEFDWKLSPDSQNYSAHYCVKNTIYSFTAGWPNAQQRPSTIAQIIKSFRLVSH